MPRLSRLIVALVVALAALWFYQTAHHGLAAMRIVRTRLAWAQQIARQTDGQQLLSQVELNALNKDLAALHHNLEGLRGDLWLVLPLLHRAGGLPLIGSDLQSIPYLLDVGIELSAAGQTALSALRPALDMVADGKARSDPLGELLVESITAAEPALDRVQRHVDAAVAARAAIVGRQFATPLGAYLEQLDRYLPMAAMAIRGAQALPAILGADRPRTYLLLAQNNDELRATGGFISSVGTLTVWRGQVTDLTLRDSYIVDDLTVDHPVPPEPLIRYMRIGVLLLRDVNWWPDFPTSAALAMRMWQENQHQAVDGVIAIDLEGMRLLVEGLGPINVEGETTPVTSANLIGLLRERWGLVPTDARQRYEWWRGRKDFVGLLARAAMTKIQNGLGSESLPRLARSLMAALTGKHFLIYSSDPAVRPLLAELHADGAVLPTRSDYLMVVDTNMGFNKVNPRIEQRLDYAVDLSGNGRSPAHLDITYLHKGSVRLAQCVQTAGYGRTYEDMMDRCYWDYVRVLTPAGSTPVIGPSSPDVELGQDGDKETLAGFFVLAPGETHRVSFDYLLPPGTTKQEEHLTIYTLVLQKQAGTAAWPVRVTVVLPKGSTLIFSNPRPAVIAEGKVMFELVLDQDRQLEVRYDR